MEALIAIRQAAEGPLRQVDLDLPIGKLICFVGRSGSGSRALAVEVLCAESRRRYLQVLSPFAPEGLGRRVAVEQVQGLPPAMHLDGRLRQRQSVAAFLQVDWQLGRLWQERGLCRCPACGGRCGSFSPEAAADEAVASFKGESCLVLAPLLFTGAVLQEMRRAGFLRVRLGGQVRRLDSADLKEGEGEVVVDRVAVDPEHRSRLVEACRQARTIARGRSLFAGTQTGQQVWLNQQLSCRQCGAVYPELRSDQLTLGGPLAVQVVFQGWRIEELEQRRVAQVLEFLSEAEGAEAARRPLAEAQALGLGELVLSQRVDQLSTGEQQRLQLASCLSRDLVGILYVFETPTLGIPFQQVGALVQGLRRLADQGNTVVALDHAMPLVQAADQIVEFADGTARQVAAWRSAAPVRPGRCGPPSRFLRVQGTFHQRELDLRVPLGCLVCVSGPSGVGKSMLLRQVIVPGLRARPRRQVWVEGKPGILRVVEAEGQVAGGSVLARLGLGERLAALYAQTPAARKRAHAAEWFLLDHPGGRCPTCEGEGVLRCDLEFFDDISLSCPACAGRRFRPEALEITWHGLAIAQVLEMPIAQAARQFRSEPGMGEVLQAAVQCGLGHCHLGQASACLERGERLRLQLAGELGRASARDLFVVEQPGGGSHPEDLGLLLEVLEELVHRGASLLVEEHHPALIEAADWVVEMALGSGPAVRRAERGTRGPQSA